jgi:hypothetical protein
MSRKSKGMLGILPQLSKQIFKDLQTSATPKLLLAAHFGLDNSPKSKSLAELYHQIFTFTLQIATGNEILIFSILKSIIDKPTESPILDLKRVIEEEGTSLDQGKEMIGFVGT